MTFQKTGDVDNKSMGQVAIADGEVAKVKIENPAHQEVLVLLKTMRSGKLALDKVLSKSESMCSLLKAKAGKK